MFLFIILFVFSSLVLYLPSNNFNKCNKNQELSSLFPLTRRIQYDQLETVIKRQVFNNSIILYCTDSGYINLFLNAYYINNLKNYRNLVVTCLDKLCYRQLT